MESPHFPTAPAAMSTAPSTPAKSTPPRIAALFGVVGGALAIASYFLPWAIGQSFNAATQQRTTSLQSGWDLINHLLNPPAVVGPEIPAGAGGAAPVYALLIAAPAILALVALVVAGMSFFSVPGPVKVGLYTAAGVMGLIGALNFAPGFYFTFTAGALAVPSGSSTVGLGLAVLELGFFGILTGGVTALAQARRA